MPITEAEASFYKLSTGPTSQADPMARELASKGQSGIRQPVMAFLQHMAGIPEVDGIALELLPNNHLAVEWTANIKIGNADPEKGEKDHGSYTQLQGGLAARAYSSSIVGVREVYSAFHQMQDALKLEGGVVSSLQFHNNLGGNRMELIRHHLARRQQALSDPSLDPQFITLGIVDHPAPVSQLADIQPKDRNIDRSLAVTFVGQGAQVVSMAQEVAQRYMMGANLVHMANEVLGYRLSDLMFKGPLEELTRTEHAQPAIYTATYTNFRVLRAMGLLNEPAVLAGSSLGEYTAYAVAGAFGEGLDGFAEGLKIVRQRGILMQEADDETGPSGLAAVSIDTTNQQLIDEFIDDLNNELGITGADDVNRIVPTNINNNSQLIIGARNRSLKEALHILEGRKTRSTRLNVSAAFHSHLMTPAAVKMGTVLDNANILPVEDPNRFVFANATGQMVCTAEEIRQALKAQVNSTVLYRDILRSFQRLGITRIVEPGTSVQTGINLSFFKGEFATETGKIELPGGIVAANYLNLSEKPAA